MIAHNVSTRTECQHCTVPTDEPSGVCTFCQHYEPPADPLVLAAGLARTAATVVHAALRVDQLGIAQGIDLVTAHEHLRAATRLIERAHREVA